MRNRVVLMSRLYSDRVAGLPPRPRRARAAGPVGAGGGADAPQHQPAARAGADAAGDVPPGHLAGLHHRQLHGRPQRAAAQAVADRGADVARAGRDQAFRARLARHRGGPLESVRHRDADAPGLRLGDRRRHPHGAAVRRGVRGRSVAGAAHRHAARRPAARPRHHRGQAPPHPTRHTRTWATGRSCSTRRPSARASRCAWTTCSMRSAPTSSTSSSRCTRWTTATSPAAPA